MTTLYSVNRIIQCIWFKTQFASTICMYLVQSKYDGSELDGSRLGTRAAAIAIAKSAAIMQAAEKDYLKELEIG